MVAVIAIGAVALTALLGKDEPAHEAGDIVMAQGTPAPVQSRTDVIASLPQEGQAQTEPDDSLPEGAQDGFDVDGIAGITDIDLEDDTAYITRLLSTYDRPLLEDFAWYEDIVQNGIWSEAEPVTELPYLLGGWKCCIVYDPYHTMDSYARELANVDIASTQDGFRLTVDWYQMYPEGENPYDESDLIDTLFTGSQEDGAFRFTGDATITLDNFFAYEGIYYGIGSMLTQDGLMADICLMR